MLYTMCTIYLPCVSTKSLQHTLRGIPQLNLPDVCTESPVRGHAFCSAHCKFIMEQHSEVPTVLRGFLMHCGVMSEGKHCNSDLLQNANATLSLQHLMMSQMFQE